MKKIALFLILITCCNSAFSQKQLWGMTSNYGVGNPPGLIFNTDDSGNYYKMPFKFEKIKGQRPQHNQLLKATNGKFYGLSTTTLFEYDPVTNFYSDKFVFDGALNWAEPLGSVIQASNGKLYGMTSKSGKYDMGIIFEYNISTNSFSKKFDFDGTNSGKFPKGSLLQATNGKLYGVTYDGGAIIGGVIFEYDINTSTFTKKFDFGGTTNGVFPLGSLMQAMDGMIYGTTSEGGTYGSGVLFQFNPNTGKYKPMQNLFGGNTYSTLLEAKDGLLYGTNEKGNGNGSQIFVYNPLQDTFATKVDFKQTSLGTLIQGSLIQTPDGMFYGLASNGGLSNQGTLFQYDLTKNLVTKLYDFKNQTGTEPRGSLLFDSDSSLYGTTSFGGTGPISAGNIFKFNLKSNKYEIKVIFTSAGNGAYPMGDLLQASNKLLYGLTSEGGMNNLGVLFVYSPFNRVYTKLYDFDLANGIYPTGSLIEAKDGMLYGLTSSDGVNTIGVLFQFNPLTNKYIKKINFESVKNGCTPLGSLFEANDGMLYGMTNAGGANNGGVLFQYNPLSNILTNKYDFDAQSGYAPRGNLIQAKDGKLYGLTFSGGAYNSGVIFQYDIIFNKFKKIFDFNYNTGGYQPTGSLTEVENGILYGLTTGGSSAGGISKGGIIFNYNYLTNVYSSKYDFVKATGHYPMGSLLLASDNKLYATTYYGGSEDLGTLFQYDFLKDKYVKKVDFGITKGSFSKGNVIEILVPGSCVKSIKKESSISIYPNPNSGNFEIELFESSNLQIFNNAGQLLYTENATKGKHYLNLKDLSTGCYFLKAIQKDNIQVAKIIVE